MNNIPTVFDHLVSFLRYFVAPVVGLIIAWVFDKDNDILIAVLKKAKKIGLELEHHSRFGHSLCFLAS